MLRGLHYLFSYLCFVLLSLNSVMSVQFDVDDWQATIRNQPRNRHCQRPVSTIVWEEVDTLGPRQNGCHFGDELLLAYLLRNSVWSINAMKCFD